MQREIKFKAKREDTEEWVYGYYIKVTENYLKYSDFNKALGDYIITKNNEFIYVIPETICQYTGLKDINGVEIYENDILQYKSIYSDKIGKDIVFFNEDYGTYEVAIDGNKNDSEVLGFYLSRLSIDTKYKVIGNIYDKEVE